MKKWYAGVKSNHKLEVFNEEPENVTPDKLSYKYVFGPYNTINQAKLVAQHQRGGEMPILKNK